MFYVNLGMRHITDLEGYDHMLFLLALTLPLSLKNWKPMLRWITAFTLGHSLALGLSAMELLKVPSGYIELAIALSIGVTAVLHLLSGFKVNRMGMLVSGVFGIVHGLGFGSYYSFIAQSDSFWWAWIPFNLGIELGQIMVVLAVLLVYWFIEKMSVRPQTYRLVISGGILALSFQMILERIPI